MAVIKSKLPAAIIRKRLAVATCSLLTQTAHAQEASDWAIDLSFLSYEEDDDRVSVQKLVGNIKGELGETDRLNMDFVFDTMTGATPTGALPTIIGASAGSSSTTAPVTITSPSGGSSTVSGGGAAGSSGSVLVALAEFEDDRIGANVEWEHDFSRTFRMAYGASFSDENDYASNGISIKLEKDDSSKLSTYTVGVAVTADNISRVGSSGVPLAMSSIQLGQFTIEEDRDTMDVLFGYSRVLNERTVAQVNASFSNSDGYHNDPYKVISVDDSGVEMDRLYESRPDSRQRDTLYGQLVHQTKAGSNQHLSYRYYSDDWGIASHTIEVSQRFNLNNAHYIEPQIRFYSQNAADFYFRSLPYSAPIPLFASSDPRLADMESQSIGIKYGFPLADGGSMRFRLESFDQSFSNAVINENTALIFQMSYKITY